MGPGGETMTGSKGILDRDGMLASLRCVENCERRVVPVKLNGESALGLISVLELKIYEI